MNRDPIGEIGSKLFRADHHKSTFALSKITPSNLLSTRAMLDQREILDLLQRFQAKSNWDLINYPNLYQELANDPMNQIDALGLEALQLNEWCKYFCIRMLELSNLFMCTVTAENCPCDKSCYKGMVIFGIINPPFTIFGSIIIPTCPIRRA